MSQPLSDTSAGVSGYDTDLRHASPRNSAPLLSRGSGRSGDGRTTTSGFSKNGGPWYLRTAYIVGLIIFLLLALGLGVGLGVGLTGHNSSTLAVVPGGAGNVTSTAQAQVISSDVIMGGGTVVVSLTQSRAVGNQTTTRQVVGAGGSTVVQVITVPGATATPPAIQVSLTQAALTEFTTVFLTAFTSTQTVLTTVGTGVVTVTQLVTTTRLTTITGAVPVNTGLAKMKRQAAERGHSHQVPH